MMDVEGGEAEADITKDFAYNNNVAGAAKHIRMGKIETITIWTNADGLDFRLPPQGLWPSVPPAGADHHHRRRLSIHATGKGNPT